MNGKDITVIENGISDIEAMRFIFVLLSENYDDGSGRFQMYALFARLLKEIADNLADVIAEWYSDSTNA